MDFAYLWEPIYLVVLSLILIVTSQQYYGLQFFNCHPNNKGTLFLSIIIAIIIGLRPPHIAFCDTINYYRDYKVLLGNPFELNLDTSNIIFDNLFDLITSQCLPFWLFLMILSLVYFICMYIACKKFFPKDYLLAFLVCTTAFSAFSAGTNGFKAGAAGSLFLVALAYNDNKIVSIIFALLSCGFHHSMKVVFIAYIVILVFKNLKFYYYFWFISLLVAAAHITYFQTYFGEFISEKSVAYLIYDEFDNTYITGFRLDFILYSAVPIVIGYWLIFRKSVSTDKTYTILLRIYLLMNSLWMLCMYASYTNRIAYLSWFMLPIVLIYPFFSFYWDDRQLLWGRKAALYHMSFTLFMYFIFYGLLSL